MTPNICPVCGMKVDDLKAAEHSTFQGKTYYFCCADCKSKFDTSPLQYTIAQAS